MTHIKLVRALAFALLLAAPAPALSQAGDPAPGTETETDAVPEMGAPQDEAAREDETDDGRGGMPGMWHHGRYGHGRGMHSGAGMAYGMYSCPMMHDYMAMHSMMHAMYGGMRGGMMGRHGKMGRHGMKGRGRHGMRGRDGGALWSGRVRPMRHLSVADVSHHFKHRLERYGNDRLKLGEVTESGEETIVAEIVTVDDSLVERLEVDRHSGRVQRAR